MLRSPPFTDDLGRRVPAAAVTKGVLRSVGADAVRRWTLAKFRRERRNVNAFLAVLLVLVAMAMTGLTDGWTPRRDHPPEVSFLMFLAAASVAASLLKPWLIAMVPSHRPERTRQRFLAALLCPACAHDLKGTPARDDGVTVCPECGAGWKMEGAERRSDEAMEGTEGISARSHEGTEGKG